MGRSRGQIILVGAFALAIIFVSLALILNTAIFTEHLATRETTDSHDAIDLHHETVETGQILLWETNRDRSTYAQLETTYKNRIANWSGADNVHAVRGGTLRVVDVRTIRRGTLIAQTAVGNLSSPDGNSTWRLTTDVTDARSVRINVSDANATTPVVFNATNGSETWSLAITEADGTYTAKVDSPTAGTSNRTFETSQLEIRPTNGTINGTTWDSLRFQDQLGDTWAVWMRNGTSAKGTYQVVVNKPETEFSWSGSADGPTLDPVLYNATLEVELIREDLTYQAWIPIDVEINPYR